MGRAIGYRRVSTAEQGERGNGLAAQIDACRAWTRREGTELTEVYTDAGLGGAAPLDKRPGLLEALATLDAGDTLIVAKRDRLGRDPIVVAMIEAAAQRKGARVVSAAGEGTDSDEPTAILMRRIVDAFSEYERLLIRSRTRAALAAKKARGERVGHIPFGQRLASDGVHLESCPAEQDVLQQIRELRAAGVSLRSIAAELNKRGLSNRGATWKRMAVYRVSGGKGLVA